MTFERNLFLGTAQGVIDSYSTIGLIIAVIFRIFFLTSVFFLYSFISVPFGTLHVAVGKPCWKCLWIA